MYNRPLLSKTKDLSIPDFLGGGSVCTQASGPKKKKKGGCLAAATDSHFSHNSHYQLKPAVIILLIGKLKMSM